MGSGRGHHVAESFDNIDHEVLLEILRHDIHDGRVIALIAGLLDAGYMKDMQRHETPGGTPQGGIVSPLLANIYLNELDEFREGAAPSGVHTRRTTTGEPAVRPPA